MSAATGPSAEPTASGAAKPTLAEPSMEDILASIRRIIATDHYGSADSAALGSLTRRAVAAAPSAQVAPVPSAATAATARLPESLVSRLAEVVPHIAEHDLQADDQAVFEEDNSPAGAAAHHVEPEVTHAAADDHAVSETYAYTDAEQVYESDDAVDREEAADLGEQPDALMSPNAGAVVSSSFQALAETVLMQDPDMIERLAREAIRPMLKAWLDENLPSMVERLVRAEIERVARGGRSRS